MNEQENKCPKCGLVSEHHTQGGLVCTQKRLGDMTVERDKANAKIVELEADNANLIIREHHSFTLANIVDKKLTKLYNEHVALKAERDKDIREVITRFANWTPLQFGYAEGIAVDEMIDNYLSAYEGQGHIESSRNVEE